MIPSYLVRQVHNCIYKNVSPVLNMGQSELCAINSNVVCEPTNGLKAGTELTHAAITNQADP